MASDDVRYAFRRVRKRPVTSIVSVLTLAIAIAAGVAAWSLIDAVLLNPLPVHEADRMVTVGDDHTYARFTAISELEVFEHVIAAGGAFGDELVEVPGQPPAFRNVWFASHDFFRALGLEPAEGRGFDPSDDRRDAPLVAVLSYRFWRDALSAPADVLGQEIRVGPAIATVVGVAPRRFRGLDLAQSPDLFLPLHTVAQVQAQGANHLTDSGSQFDSPYAWLTVIGLLRSGASLEQAQAGVRRLFGSRLDLALTPVATSAVPAVSRGEMEQFARVLMLTVGLLLLIGALTVGMLLLMRTDERREELSLCLALGARRGRLAWGIALEGILMAVAGAMLAVPAAAGMLASVRAFELPGGIGIELLDVGVDAGMAVGSGLTAVAVSLVIVLVAAVSGSASRPGAVIQARPGATRRPERRRLRGVLVVGQLAVALLLLACAGLFVRSLMAGLALNPGFDSARVASATVSIAPLGYTHVRADQFFADLRSALDRDPRIQSAATSAYRGGMTPRGVVHIDGVPFSFPSAVLYRAVDPYYFSTIGLPLLRGRDLSPSDQAGTPNVAVVSESFARLLADGGDPLGRMVTAGSQDPVEVIGVVPDVVTSIETLEPLAVYRPFSQTIGTPNRSVVLRADEPVAAGREAVAAMRRLDPAIVPPVFMTIEDRLRDQMSSMRFGARVLGALGTIALLITLMSIYVIAASVAAQRRKELGIRAALGATAGQLRALVFQGTAGLACLGIAAGLLLVWLGSTLMRGLLFGIESFDAVTVIVVSAVVVILVLVVGLRPALSASRVDLARVLREE